MAALLNAAVSHFPPRVTGTDSPKSGPSVEVEEIEEAGESEQRKVDAILARVESGELTWDEANEKMAEITGVDRVEDGG